MGSGISGIESKRFLVMSDGFTGQALIGQPVYDSTGTKVIGTNYGSVTFQGASTAT